MISDYVIQEPPYYWVTLPLQRIKCAWPGPLTDPHNKIIFRNRDYLELSM